MALDFQVQILGLDNAQRAMRDLPRRGRVALDRGTLQLAEAYHRQVLREYAHQVDPSPGTQKVRSAEGFPPTPALKRTGAMQAAIEVERRGPAFYTVAIRDPLQAYKARIHEEGRSFDMQLSRASWAYIMNIFFDGAPPSAALYGSPPLVHIRIPPRPAWGPAMLALSRRLHEYLVIMWGTLVQDLPGFAGRR